MISSEPSTGDHVVNHRHIAVPENGQHDKFEGLERRSQCRDVAAERRAEGKDKTHQDAHENYDPGDEILL